MQVSSDLTQMLLRWSEGDQEALDRLFPMVYDELRKLAHARIREERPGHTLNTTALVHEAYLKLVDLDRVQWQDRAHFFALSARVMRHLLVNYAHRRKTRKRGGDRQRVDLDEERLIPDAEVDRLLDLDEALTRLAAQHPRPAKAVEHSYFGGLTNEETAAVLGVSQATVERDLRLARAWLARALGRNL
jgi:RNA polymerase sigma factor (TIGR02999 family)